MRHKLFEPSFFQKIRSGRISPSNSASNNNIFPFDHNVQLQKTSGQQINLLHEENYVLKQENSALRRELEYLRSKKVLNFKNRENQQMNDLRSTIKQQAGEIKDLKIRMQMLSKQCKIYEDIIDKMEVKISKLIQEKQKIQYQHISLKNAQKRFERSVSIQKTSKLKLKDLNQKINKVIKKVQDLEQKMRKESKQWIEWKKYWNLEKIFFLNRIKQLQEQNQLKKRC